MAHNSPGLAENSAGFSLKSTYWLRNIHVGTEIIRLAEKSLRSAKESAKKKLGTQRSYLVG